MTDGSDDGWQASQSPSTPPASPTSGRHGVGRPGSGSVDRRLIPTAPPARTRPDPIPATAPFPTHYDNTIVSGRSFLPPTPPPGTANPRFGAVGPPARESFAAAQDPGGRATSRWGWRPLVAFVVGGLLAAAGFGASQLANDSESPQTAATATTPIRSESSAAPPIVVQPPDVDTTEPAAFVAQILGPSVVQVEVPNVGLGSGVVFADGLILTNHHVVAGAADSVDVRTADGRVITGELLGSDARTDVAVISVGPGSGLPVAQLGSSDELQVGQLAIAIGSPFELQQTVTSGIISALNRPLYNGVGLNAMIQTDTAINPGNSGGPLADRTGRVIGLNTAIQTDGVGNSNIGVGYAIPIDTALNIADRIMSGDPLIAGFLGVEGDQANDGSSGVEVTGVTPGSAAESAGVRVSDRIIGLNGGPITSLEELAGLVQTQFPGDEVEIDVVRGGETLTLTAVLGER